MPKGDQQLPDAGFIYTGPMFHREGWTPAPGKCRASCSESFGNSTNFWQCTRNAKVDREVLFHGKAVTLGYCGQHDPLAVRDRQARRNAKWKAEWDERDRKAKERERQRDLEREALEVVRQIAAGHNDARGLALELLARFELESAE